MSGEKGKQRGAGEKKQYLGKSRGNIPEVNEKNW